MKLLLCKNCNSELTKGKKNYICEECRAQFPFEEIEPQSLENWERDVLDNYPTMISVPFKELIYATDIISREKNLIDTFTNILKFLSLTILTDYLLSNSKERDINEKIKSLYTPKISDWNEFLKTSITIMHKKKINFSIPEVIQYYKAHELEISEKNKIILKKGHYNSEGDFIPTEGRLGYFSALISYRNSIAHGVGSENLIKIEKFNKVYRYLEEILSNLKFLKNYEMYANQGGRGILLKGLIPTHTDLITSRLDPLKVSIFLINSEGIQRPLSPLFINGSIAIKNPSEEQLGKYNHFIFDKITDKRIFYVSPEGKELPTEITIEYWKKLLKSKQVDISLIHFNNFSIEELNTRVVNYSRNALNEYYNHNKLIKDIYLKRSLEEAKIKSFLSSPTSIAILTSEGGGGKSYLLGKYTEENLSTEPILFLNAGDLEHVTFMDSLIDILHFESAFFNKDLPSTFSMKIFLDGVNERSNPKEYLIDIVHFIQKYSKHFKILLSYRLDLDGTLPQMPHELNINEIFYPGGSEDQFQKEGLEKFAIHLEKLQNHEIDNLWELYKQRTSNGLFDKIFPNKKWRWIDYDELTNPLIFRIFCSIYDEKNLPRNFTQSMLWKKYLNNLDKEIPGSSQLLVNLSLFMLEKKQYSIDYDSLLSHPVLQIDFKKTQIEAIWVKLLNKGILFRKMQEDTQTFKISIEPLMDYLTGEVMISISPDLKSIERLMKDEKYPPLQRGLVYYLSNCIQINNLNLLSEFIDSISIEDLSIPAKALAEFFRYEKELTSKGEALLNSILSIQTENDAGVILITVKILKENLNMILSEKILEYFIKWYKKENWEYVEVLLEYASRDNLSVRKRIEILNSANLFSKSLKKDDEKLAKLYFSIAYIYQIGERYDYSIENYEKTLKLFNMKYGKFNIYNAEINLNLGVIYSRLKKIDKAVKLLNDSINIISSIPGRNEITEASIYKNLFLILINNKNILVKDNNEIHFLKK
jgi:hypothetical protein